MRLMCSSCHSPGSLESEQALLTRRHNARSCPTRTERQMSWVGLRAVLGWAVRTWSMPRVLADEDPGSGR